MRSLWKRMDLLVEALEKCGIKVLQAGTFDDEPPEFLVLEFPDGQRFRLEARGYYNNPAWLHVTLESDDE